MSLGRLTMFVINDSCQVIAAEDENEQLRVTYSGIIRCVIVVLITFALIAGNLILALAVNNKCCSRRLQFQTRTLLTAMATNNLAIGFLVTMWITYPSLTACWPYGVLICQIQAVLRGSLGLHSSILFILMAVDRYLYSRWPSLYPQIASSKHCVWVVAMTWMASFAYYTALVLPYDAYDFSPTGLMGCEPVPQTGAFMLISTCLFYFPTTMTVLYVYGTVFHDTRPAKSSLKPRKQNLACTANYCCLSEEDSVTKTMATMSLAFVIDSTPWVVKQVIVACLGKEIAAWLDFTITWSSVCLGVINPLLCWLLCPPIRMATSKQCRKSDSLECHTLHTTSRDVENIPGIPDAIYAHCELHNPHSSSAQVHFPTTDEIVPPEERVWGEILERTLSSTSLHRLQRMYTTQTFANGQHFADADVENESTKRNNGKVIWQI